MVDDHPVFLREASQFLQERGHNELVVVGTARNSAEAISQARELCPNVVLLDLNMPGMNGLDLIPHLRVLLPSAYLIVVTMLDDTRYRNAVLAAGANDFVSKSVVHAELLPAIRRYRPWLEVTLAGDVPRLVDRCKSINPEEIREKACKTDYHPDG
jgi:DNA-binding NarL/FixJ family response regulator